MSARLFSDVLTDIVKDATASSVHVPTALGNEKPRRKAKLFNEVAKRYASTEDLPATVKDKLKGEPKKQRQWMHVFNSELNSHGDESRAFASAWAAVEKIAKRELKPHDEETAKTPFVYDVNALGSLRPDQVPRFFGALTDSNKLPEAEVPMDSLVAMQDRVDPKKVEAIRSSDSAGGKLPVVVQHNGKNYIADGHHRLAAQWLDGEEKAKVRVKDLEPVSNALKGLAGTEDNGATSFRIAKVDQSLGLVFGWAIVCKVNGEDYYDLNIDTAGPHKGERVPEHITEAAMVKAAVGFADEGYVGNEMHDGPDVGHYPFTFPLTTEIAKAMGIQSEKTGLMVAYKPPASILAKFASGEYTGFSIEGRRIHYQEHD